MRIKVLAILYLLFLSVSPLLANGNYLGAFRMTAKAYQVEVAMDQMKLIPDATGGQSFHVSLRSNRNNYESLTLVGYIAAGEAMKTGVEPSEVHVSVHIPLDNGYLLQSWATREDVKKLISEEITRSQFWSKVHMELTAF